MATTYGQTNAAHVRANLLAAALKDAGIAVLTYEFDGDKIVFRLSHRDDCRPAANVITARGQRASGRMRYGEPVVIAYRR